MRTANGVSYSLATYDDLIDIILENWECFRKIFMGVGKGKIKKRLQSVNYKYRRQLAHPHKAEQEGFVFKDTDVVGIRDVHAMVQFAMRNISAQNGVPEHRGKGEP